MKNKIKIILLLLPFAAIQQTYCQTNQEIALSKGEQAVNLMDVGKLDESIKLLKEAQSLDPERITWPYELAYAYFLKGEYKETIKLLEKNKNHTDVSERFFQLLGNCYDVMGKTKKAFESYDAGLVKFPNSGMILLEKGNAYYGKKEFDKALSFYEKGIEVDPEFPSNYYRAAQMYLRSAEEVWGMIYGEIFINLERNSDRTSEMSKLLFDTYKREITFTSDSSFSVSFSKNAFIDVEDLSTPGKLTLPFGMGAYEPTLMMSVLNEKTIDLNSLDRIRTRFVESYTKMGNDKKYPNILFEYQNSMLKEEHLEAYNHWLLMKGDENAFAIWYNSNKEKWDAFVKWFSDNRLVVNKLSKFHSKQY